MKQQSTYRFLKCGITIFIFFVSIISIAQTNRVTINPYSQSILIGEQVRVELSVNASANEKIIWPEFKDTITTPLEIIEAHPIDTLFDDSITKANILGYQKKWVITSFDSGLWAFPEITVWIDSIPFSTEAFLFEVNTVEVDTAKEFVDIIEPIEVPMTFLEYIQAYYIYGLITYGILILAAIITFIIGKTPEREPEIQLIQKILPHLLALDRLNQLKSEQLWQAGAFKAYHIQISDIIREYIENRFQIPVKESTTDEIKHLLKRIRIEKHIRTEIIESLRVSDLVKFAKAIPLSEENERCMDIAFQLVEQTQIVESPKEDTGTHE
jgi:hypothetical protein